MLSLFRRRACGRPSGGCVALLFLVLVAQTMTSGTVRADGQAPYRGRLLVDVLNEFRDGGLELIFSTAVVGGDVRVSVEPVATDPLEALKEILAPLGLEVGDGPGDSLLILPATPRFGSLSGVVASGHGDVPIRRATVTLAGTRARTRSGRDGSFELERVPAGTHDVTVEAFGFQTATVTAQVTTGEEARLRVTLAATPAFSTEIVVTPSRRFILQQGPDPARAIDHEGALLVPAIGGDPNRVVGLLPGVTASDNSAAFHMRGSLQEDVAIVLDGMELYDPYHLRNFQSPFSLVDSEIVDRIDVVGGGFTVERGDRHGGFMDISTIQPEVRNQGAVAVGTLHSRLSYSGQLNNRSAASWLVSLRGWYPEAEHEAFKLGGGERLDPRFFDAYSKFSFVVTPRAVLSAHSLLSFDRIEFNESTASGEHERVNVLTRNGYLWLRLRNSWNPGFASETVLSGGRIDRNRDGISETGPDTSVTVRDDRLFNFLELKHDSTWQLSGSRALRAGFDVRRLNAHYRYANFQDGDATAPADIAIAPDGTALGLYVAHRARVSKNLATEVGLRWDRQSYTEENQYSPRLNATWLGERSEVLLAIGRFSQSQRIHELRVEDGETTFQPAELSNQAEVTFKHTFQGGLRLRVDGFYRELFRVRPRHENLFEPVELFPETGSDRVLVAPDRARLRGVEIMLQSPYDRPLTWWISYARSSTEDYIDGRAVPRSWDEPDAAKFLIGRRWSGRWIASLSGTAHTGWPTTPVHGEITSAPGSPVEVEQVLGQRNSDRFATYARLDAKVSGAYDLPRGKLGLTVQIVNLTDRRNPCCVNAINLTPREDGTVDVERDYDYWLGITPSFTLSWEF